MTASGPPSALPRRPPRVQPVAAPVPGWERAAATLGLAYFAVGVSFILRAQGRSTLDLSASDALASAVQNLVYLAGFALAALYARSVAAAVGRAWPAVSLVALAVLSTAWSVEGGLTVRRSYALVGSTVFALYFAARFTLREQIGVLRGVCVLLLLGSALFAVAFPSWGVDQDLHRGAWIGLFPGKNPLGRFAALSLLCFVVSAKARVGHPWLSWGYCLLAGVVLVCSDSKTSLVLACIVVILPFWGRVLRLPPAPAALYTLLALGLAGTVGGWIANNAEAVLGSLGRDSTLTGRTAIWPVAIAAAIRRFWLGYGYATFWVSPRAGVGTVWRVAGWEAIHAHNGLLEVWLDLGMLGVLFALAGLGVVAVRALQGLRRTADLSGLWPISFLVFLVVSNMTESTFLRHNNLYWVLYVAAAATLWLRARPAPRRPGTARPGVPRHPAPRVRDLRHRTG